MAEIIWRGENEKEDKHEQKDQKIIKDKVFVWVVHYVFPLKYSYYV